MLKKTFVYAILCYAMSVFNLYRSLTGTSAMNIAFTVVWLALGIFETFQYFKTKNRK